MESSDLSGSSRKVNLANIIIAISEDDKNIKILKNRFSMADAFQIISSHFPGYTIERDGLLIFRQ